MTHNQNVDHRDGKIDFTTFLLSISSAAFMALGVTPGHEQTEGGRPSEDLSFAKQNIDLLELMFEKTKGNRSPDEEKLLEQLLFEVRLRYVENVNKRNEAKNFKK